MSYDLATYKWGDSALGSESGQITWFGDLSAGLSFDEDLYDLADFDAALDSAFLAWEEVAQIDFVEVSSADEAAINVYMAELGGSTIGQATTTFYIRDGLDQAFDADIRLDSTEMWSPVGVGDLNFFAVSLHEIGHVLGLDHVDDTTEIMNDYLVADDLGDGDITGIQILYGTDGTEPPLIDEEEDGGGAGVEIPIDGPPEAEAADPPEAPAAEDDGGDGGDDGGGSGIGAILAGLLGLLALLFGIGGGGVGVAALAVTSGRDDDHDDHDHDHGGKGGDPITLGDLLENTGTLSGDFYAKPPDEDHDHDHDHLVLF